jgi:hypothetical protein
MLGKPSGRPHSARVRDPDRRVRPWASLADDSYSRQNAERLIGQRGGAGRVIERGIALGRLPGACSVVHPQPDRCNFGERMTEKPCLLCVFARHMSQAQHEAQRLPILGFTAAAKYGLSSVATCFCEIAPGQIMIRRQADRSTQRAGSMSLTRGESIHVIEPADKPLVSCFRNHWTGVANLREDRGGFYHRREGPRTIIPGRMYSRTVHSSSATL